MWSLYSIKNCAIDSESLKKDNTRRDRNLYPLRMRQLILPTIALSTPIKIWNEYKKEMRAEAFGLDELKAYQTSKLREIVSHAYEKVALYQTRLRQIGFHPEEIRNEADLLQIPPMIKEDIMSNLPEGSTAEGMDRRKWKYVTTSGTTRQIMGIHDFAETNANWEAGLRAHKLAGDHDVGKKRKHCHCSCSALGTVHISLRVSTHE